MGTYLTGSTGFFSSYFLDLHRENIHREPPRQTEEIFFSTATFQRLAWTKRGQEFEWQGKMYDVTSLVRKGDGVVLSCFRDGAEEDLLAMLTSWRKSHPTGKGQLQPQCCQPLPAWRVTSRNQAPMPVWPGNILEGQTRRESPPPRA